MKTYRYGTVLLLLGIMFFSCSVGNAAPITDISFSMADAAADPAWTKTGAGGTTANTIAADYLITRSDPDLQSMSNDFLFEADISAFPPALAGQAGARIWAKIHTDDLPIPNQYREVQMRLMKEANNSLNFIGLYSAEGNLAKDIYGNDAMIQVPWEETNPRYRFRIQRISDQIMMQVLSSIDNSLLMSVSAYLNSPSFTTQIGAPYTSEIGFGNALAGSTISTWENLHYSVWEHETVPVPEPATMLLFGTGLASLAGTRIRREKEA
ncbi:MAG: PEP-CTERM sorting domain-containing protein [Gammaproteobacteria bacterium]|nr:PEP-CTERM sorting domain-containing protein [Gammaproteobacteria bacterium]